MRVFSKLKSLSELLKRGFLSVQYWMENSKNHFRCKIIGEKPNPKSQNNTIILYRLLGKRQIFEIPIRELLEDKALIEQCDPLQALKIGVIAMGDIFFSEDPATAKEKFAEIKKKLLKELE